VLWSLHPRLSLVNRSCSGGRAFRAEGKNYDHGSTIDGAEGGAAGAGAGADADGAGKGATKLR